MLQKTRILVHYRDGSGITLSVRDSATPFIPFYQFYPDEPDKYLKFLKIIVFFPTGCTFKF